MSLNIQQNMSLKKLSTFAIGGNCKYYTVVKSNEELKNVFFFIKKNNLSYFIIGNGSNLLFDDMGFDGVIIHNKIEGIHLEGNYLKVGAGELLSKIITYTVNNNLSGLEHLAGIPATVGGAIFMNAGACGNSISSKIQNVTFMHYDGKIELFDVEDIKFSYRSSSFMKLQGVIVEATFSFIHKKNIKEDFLNYIEKRKKTQPLISNSAGCVFRNPQDNFAGRLIEKCGLKGKSIGGAKISDKHANFIVNENKALSNDVKSLILLIKKLVKNKYDIDLEEEMQYVPYSN